MPCLPFKPAVNVPNDRLELVLVELSKRAATEPQEESREDIAALLLRSVMSRVCDRIILRRNEMRFHRVVELDKRRDRLVGREVAQAVVDSMYHLNILTQVLVEPDKPLHYVTLSVVLVDFP